MAEHAPTPVVLSWSGGKDSAMALHVLRGDPRYEVVSLLTTVAGEYQRISHHGVRLELLEEQAEAVGVPLHVLELPPQPTNAVYEQAMEEAMRHFLSRGVRTVAFGDLFLEDLRRYRESNLARVDMHGLFPLWGRDTTAMIHEFVDLGFRAHLVCVDGQKLTRGFAGRPLDGSLLADLPEDVDPCGENGEYHSFVHDGPVFTHPVPVRVGEIVSRDVRHFADLVAG
ncbi:MAG: ATP-binding protein [Myxococcota bacterium]